MSYYARRYIPDDILNRISVGVSLYFISVLAYLYSLLLSSWDVYFGSQVLQAVSGFLLLSFFPGWFIVNYLTNKATLNNILYAVGISVSITMTIGWCMNSFHNTFYWFPKLAPETVIPVYLILYSGAAIFSIFNKQKRAVYTSDIILKYNWRIVSLLATIPTIAIIGSYIINVHSNNILTLLSLLTVAILPVLVYYLDETEKYHIFSILSISISLLLGNTVINSYNHEGTFRIASQVLQSGSWDPVGTMGSMPRSAILHPIYAIVMDISIFWEFKLVHPILFALTPIIVYKISEKYFSTDTAFLSAVVYIWMPRTHVALARNIRTGSAIFFSALLFLVLLDNENSRKFASIAASIFFISVITSHYGIGPLVLMIILIGYITNKTVAHVLGDRSRYSVSFKLAMLFPVIFYYIYNNVLTDVFLFLTDAVYKRTLDKIFFNETSSTATRSLSYEMPSISYAVQYYGHMLISIMILVGMIFLLIAIISYRSHILPDMLQETFNKFMKCFSSVSSVTANPSLLFSMSTGACLLIALTFGPIPLSIGRLFGLVMILLSPMVVISAPTLSIGDLQISPVLIIMVVLFIFTSGFVSAAITNDVSPNPRIDGDRILNSGSTTEKFSYFRRSYSESSTFASAFVQSHVPKGSVIEITRLSRYKPQFRGDATKEDEFEWTRLKNTNGPVKYAFYTHVDISTGVATQKWRGFIYYSYIELPSKNKENKVYTTGYDRITSDRSTA